MRLHFFTFWLSVALIASATVMPAYSQENTEIPELSNNIPDAEARYISDELFIYLRSGPGPDYRLLGSINAGTKVNLLNIDREASYAEIIDERQRTGWVEIRFVSRIPTIRYQLEDMQASMIEKDQEVSLMKTEVDAVMRNLAKFDDQKATLNRQITQQLEEIARLNERIAKRERANNMQWFTRGAILAGICVFVGYLMGLFGRKRNNNDRLM
jgi:SH3 domain protein